MRARFGYRSCRPVPCRRSACPSWHPPPPARAARERRIEVDGQLARAAGKGNNADEAVAGYPHVALTRAPFGSLAAPADPAVGSGEHASLAGDIYRPRDGPRIGLGRSVRTACRNRYREGYGDGLVQELLRGSMCRPGCRRSCQRHHHAVQGQPCHPVPPSRPGLTCLPCRAAADRASCLWKMSHRSRRTHGLESAMSPSVRRLVNCCVLVLAFAWSAAPGCRPACGQSGLSVPEQVIQRRRLHLRAEVADAGLQRRRSPRGMAGRRRQGDWRPLHSPDAVRRTPKEDRPSRPSGSSCRRPCGAGLGQVLCVQRQALLRMRICES